MKTVLVLTLLAVAIACCYARPAARRKPSLAPWRSSHPVQPKQQSTRTLICHKEKMAVKCFQEDPLCQGEWIETPDPFVCCLDFQGQSFEFEPGTVCHPCLP